MARFGAPTINVSTFSLIGGTGILPAGRIDTTWYITDSLSWELGKHQLKLGGEVRSAYLDVFYESRKRGVFNFDGTRGPWTNLTSAERAVADFLAGYTTPANGRLPNRRRLAVQNDANHRRLQSAIPL